MKLRYLFLLFTTVLLATCESYDQDSYQEYVVVESYAVANNPLPPVRVFTTGPANQRYDALESTIANANVQIVQRAADGDVINIYEYRYSDKDGGVYEPILDDIVQPKSTYELIVYFEDRDETVRAVTTVPDQFEILNQVPPSIIYQATEQLEIIISETERTQDQNVFVFSTIAEDTSLANLTPFYSATVDDGNAEVSDFVINSSGLINEGNFEINEDGTITLQFPWIGVAFYGKNRIVTQSVDENLNDLVRSQQVQLGGSTLSPGEIPNLIYNTSGGIGIFGSLSSDTVTTVIERPF